MNEMQALIDTVLRLFMTPVNIFGRSFTYLQAFIVFAFLGIMFWFIKKLFE